jgi:hypothetical protein
MITTLAFPNVTQVESRNTSQEGEDAELQAGVPLARAAFLIMLNSGSALYW